MDIRVICLFSFCSALWLLQLFRNDPLQLFEESIVLALLDHEQEDLLRRVLVHQRNDMLRLADQRAIDPHQRFGMLRKTGNVNVFLFLKPFQHRLNRIDGDVGKILLNISGGQILIMSPEYLHDIGFSFGEMGFCHDHHSLRFYFKRTKLQMQSVLTAISPDQTIKKSKRDHDKSACFFH